MATYSIRDLEYLSGIKAHTIRIWEQRYGIVEPYRSETNIRYYDDSALRRLLNVSFLNQNGYKISKIAALSENEILSLVDKISMQNATESVLVGSLILSMVNLDEVKFKQILDAYTQQQGFEKTISEIIFPFLARVGILWRTGEVNASQEHFISNLIRQKILGEIDKISVIVAPNAQKAILFLPEGEWHEIGLLFAYYIVKVRGYKVLYLGQSLPYEDLKSTVELWKPDLLLCSITTTPAQAHTITYAQKLRQDFSETKIILSGYQVLSQKEKMPEGIFILNDLISLITFLEN